MTLASSGVFLTRRKKQAHVSCRQGRVEIRVHPHQDAGLEEPMISLPPGDVHLRPRINSLTAVDLLTEPAILALDVIDSIQHTARSKIPFRGRESSSSTKKKSPSHKHR